MQSRHLTALVISIIVTALITLAAAPRLLDSMGGDKPLTAQQGEAILNELAEVRASLQRLETQQRPARPAVPKMASVTSRDRPALGSSDAPVTVVEFTDYQCPFCRRFAQTTFDRLKTTYIDTGKVRWVVRDMPLGFHNEAEQAARAAHCAGEQGKFWEYRALLYRNQDKLKPEALASYATQTGINEEPFRQCLNSRRYADLIGRDLEEAKEQKISGTPTFVIGRSTPDVITGKRVVGAQAYKVFSEEIERLLKAD